MNIAIIAGVVIVIILVIGFAVYKKGGLAALKGGWQREVSFEWVSAPVSGATGKGYPWIDMDMEKSYLKTIQFHVPDTKTVTDTKYIQDKIEAYLKTEKLAAKYAVINRHGVCGIYPGDSVNNCSGVNVSFMGDGFRPVVRSATNPEGNVQIIIPAAPYSAYGVPSGGAKNVSMSLASGGAGSVSYNADVGGSGVWRLP